MRRLLFVFARLMSVAAALLFLLAAPVQVYAGEPILPYLAVVAAWIAFYWAIDAAARRWEGPTPAIGARRFWRPGVLVFITLLGVMLAFLSLGLAARYAQTPASIRALQRATTHHVDRLDGGRRLAYYSAGSGPRLIFIHGTPGYAGVFSAYLLDPIAGLQSISVDRPGYMDSRAGGPATSFTEQARIIATLLEERDGCWPILVGHSLGGPIAARIAADYPEKVSGLVILAGSLDPNLEVPRWYNDLSTFPGINFKMPGLYQASNAEIAAAPRQTRLLAEVLHRVRCPVRVVHGTADGLVPVANTEFIKRTFTGSSSIEAELVPGEGHAVHTQQEELVRRVIEELARAIEATPRTP